MTTAKLNPEVIIFELEQLDNGMNTHTVNKAKHYIRTLSKPNWLVNEETREERYRSHLENCHNAYLTGDTKPLKDSMRQWI